MARVEGVSLHTSEGCMSKSYFFPRIIWYFLLKSLQLWQKILYSFHLYSFQRKKVNRLLPKEWEFWETSSCMVIQSLSFSMYLLGDKVLNIETGFSGIREIISWRAEGIGNTMQGVKRLGNNEMEVMQQNDKKYKFLSVLFNFSYFLMIFSP